MYIYINNLVIFLLFILPLISSVLGVFAYLPLVLFLFSYIFIVYYYKRHVYLSAEFYKIFILLFFMLLYALVSQRLNVIFFSFMSILHLFFSYFLIFQDKKKILKISLSVLILFYLFVAYSGFTIGWSHLDMNNYFLNSSRNALVAMGIFYQILYSVNFYRVYGNMPLLSPVLLTALAIIAIGRSGIAISFLIILFSNFIRFYNSKKSLKIFLCIIGVGCTVYFYNYLKDLLEILVGATKFSRGFETERIDLFLSYLNIVDFEMFLIGVNLQDTIPFCYFGGNPHNSFILGHSFYGLFYILFIVFFLFASTSSVLIYKYTIVYYFLFLVFLLRLNFDILGLPGVYDFIFYYVFLLLTIKKAKKPRDIIKI